MESAPVYVTREPEPVLHALADWELRLLLQARGLREKKKSGILTVAWDEQGQSFFLWLGNQAGKISVK